MACENDRTGLGFVAPGVLEARIAAFFAQPDATVIGGESAHSVLMRFQAAIDVADAVFTLEALFAGGSNPPHPYPGCGLESETNPDHLECQSYGVCP